MDLPNQRATLTSAHAVTGGVVCRVQATHQLSEYDTSALHAEVMAAAAGASGRVALDMTKVVYVNSAVLGVLTQINKECAAMGGRLVLFGLSAEIANLLKITRLDRVIVAFGNEAVAIAGFAKK